MKSFFKIGFLSSEEIVKKLLNLSIFTFLLYMLNIIIGHFYNLLFVCDKNGVIVNDELEIMVSKTFYWIKIISTPIIGLLFFRLLCEIVYKILKATEKYLNSKE